MDTKEDFILVTKNHKRCAKRKVSKKLNDYSNRSQSESIDIFPNKNLTTKIDEIFQDGSFMSTFDRFIEELLKCQHVADVICYGLGNFYDCFQAQYQLALLKILLDKLKMSNLLHNAVEIFDPQFIEVEKCWLKENDFRVLSTNELALRTVDRFTVFYMPHCGRGLYNNVLYANWSTDRLKNLCIIGNSFKSIVDKFQNCENDQNVYRYICEAQTFCEELELPHLNNSFEGTSIHYFVETVFSSVNLNPKCALPPVYDYGTSEVL